MGAQCLRAGAATAAAAWVPLVLPVAACFRAEMPVLPAGACCGGHACSTRARTPPAASPDGC